MFNQYHGHVSFTSDVSPAQTVMFLNRSKTQKYMQSMDTILSGIHRMSIDRRV